MIKRLSYSQILNFAHWLQQSFMCMLLKTGKKARKLLKAREKDFLCLLRNAASRRPE